MTQEQRPIRKFVKKDAPEVKAEPKASPQGQIPAQAAKVPEAKVEPKTSPQSSVKTTGAETSAPKSDGNVPDSPKPNSGALSKLPLKKKIGSSLAAKGKHAPAKAAKKKEAPSKATREEAKVDKTAQKEEAKKTTNIGYISKNKASNCRKT